MDIATLTPPFLDLAFVRGLAVGFALAAPMGPVAVLCIRRALARGFFQAFAAGLGAALADMTFGGIAGLGITAISTFVFDYETIIASIGGTLVLALGVSTYRTPVVITNGAVAVNSLRRDFAAAFSMAITNPATMIAAFGVFAAFGPINVESAPRSAAWLMVGVLAGSAAWWLILAGVVTTLRGRFVAGGAAWLNRASGGVIAGSGVLVLTAMAVKVLKAAG